jgi:hypothetical protein
MSLVALVSASGMPAIALASSEAVNTEELSSQIQSLQTLPQMLGSVKQASIQEPDWLRQQNAAEALARASQTPVTKTVAYSVTTKGAITANIAEFRTQANTTLNDPRGWARMGVAFEEVATGGSFTLVLSEASQVPSFSSGCGTEYSCRVGRYVVINQDRWLGATNSWNRAGGSLRDYRHMVVNHETGHWLGHDHSTCGGVGQPASVMQQQSIDLNGCTFNPWPLTSELWSTQLGVRRT